jgi:lipid-A-disaccharide synthase
VAHQLNKELCISCGELSGDLLGASVVRNLRKHLPDLQIWGMTGPALRNEQVETIIPMEQQSVMGFTQVLRHLPVLLKTLGTLTKVIVERRPSVVLLIDYPGFHLRLAKRLRKAGFEGKIVQMVSPSVWAHSPGRIVQMAQTLDHLLTIFPFEASYFEGSGLPVTYIGNPVAERVRRNTTAAPELVKQLSTDHTLIGLFPGSRPQDLKAHLPTLLAVGSALLQRHPECRLLLSCAGREIPQMVHELCAKHDTLQIGENLLLVDQARTLAMMPLLRLAIAKSGTITLELALSGVPTVCGYAISWINAAIVKLILHVRLRYYCIVNILRNREVFPECIFRDFRCEQLLVHAESLLQEGPVRQACIEECCQLQQDLAHPAHPSERAAEVLVSLLVQ